MNYLSVLRVVTEMHASGLPAWKGRGLTVNRVSGGHNNALYQVSSGRDQIACKLCVPDNRRRASQEYGALTVLTAAGLDLAPEPLWLDETCIIAPYPAVLYRWLPGEAVTHPLSQKQLDAFVETIQQCHDVRIEEHVTQALKDSWFHWFDAQAYLREMQSFLDSYGDWLAPQSGGSTLRQRLDSLLALVVGMVRAVRLDLHRAHVPLRLCRVDANLRNCIWDGSALRWVDWEYSGWGDPALDLADLRWHAALDEMSPQQHAWVRERYRRPSNDATFEQRLAMYDHLLVTRWPFLILRAWWSSHNGPDRQRLSRDSEHPEDLRRRFLHFLERAERFVSDPSVSVHSWQSLDSGDTWARTGGDHGLVGVSEGKPAYLAVGA